MSYPSFVATVVVCSLLLPPFSHAQGDRDSARATTDVSPSTAALLEATEKFANDPLFRNGNAAMKTIVRFVDSNEDYRIVFDAKLHSWITAEPQSKYAEQLMLAFIAGNLRAQLETGVTTDDTYSGLVFMFRVYKNIKMLDKELTNNIIEKQIEAYRSGNLSEYIKKFARPSEESGSKPKEQTSKVEKSGG
jgi:hypothetical protein